MSVTDVNDRATALVATSTPKPTSDLLARAFLDILTRASGDDSKSMLRIGHPDDPIEQLLDDLSSGSSRDDQISIRPDVAAIAVLTARALETVPGLIKDLRRASPVVSIATHNPEYVALVAEVLEACAFGSDFRVQQNERYEPSRHGRSALVISRDGTGSGHTPDRGNDTIAAALHAQSPIIGVATDPRRHLPRDLMRTSEHHLVLGDLDESAISLVIEAVTVAFASALTIKADADRSKLLPRPKTDEEFRRLTPGVITMAARAILDGKDGFSSIADKIRERAGNRPGFYGVKKELLPLICAGADAHLSGDTHRIVRAAIHDDMKRSGDGNPLRRRDYGLGQEYLGLHALSGITGLRPVALRRLADSGLVEVIAATDAKKSPKLMAAADVVPLAEVYSDSLLQRSVAMQLSVNSAVLPALEARGLIHRIDGPVTTLFESEETHYRRGEVEKLAAEIQSRILAFPGGTKVARLSLAVKGLMLAPIPWGAVIAAIISNKVEIYRAPGKSRSWRTGAGVKDLPGFLDAVRSEVIAEDSKITGKWIGNQTAAELLGLTVTAISVMATKGLLRRDGPGDTLFDVDEARSFRARYIFAPEIEQRTGVLKRTVRSWLLDFGIEPELSLEENKYMAYPRRLVEKVIASQIQAEWTTSLARVFSTESVPNMIRYERNGDPSLIKSDE